MQNDFNIFMNLINQKRKQAPYIMYNGVKLTIDPINQDALFQIKLDTDDATIEWDLSKN